MKGVGRPEQDHLRRTCRGGQMHRRGVDGHEKPCLANQRGQCEQICLSREIDDLLLRLGLYRRDMRLLIGRWSTCQNKMNTVVSAKVLNHLCPLPRLPKLLLARRAWMQD